MKWNEAGFYLYRISYTYSSIYLNTSLEPEKMKGSCDVTARTIDAAKDMLIQTIRSHNQDHFNMSPGSKMLDVVITKAERII